MGGGASKRKPITPNGATPSPQLPAAAAAVPGRRSDSSVAGPPQRLLKPNVASALPDLDAKPCCLAVSELDAAGYDLVVIGGGPAGFAAALKATYLGQRALIVDKPEFIETGATVAKMEGLDPTFAGPTGLWSKALRDTAKHLDITSLKAQKLHPAVIWLQVQTMCARLAVRNAESQVELLRQFKIDYAQGIATLVDGGVSVKSVSGDSSKTVKAQHVLVATGSKARRMDGIPFDDVRVFESDSIAKLAFLPNSIAIQGSGIVAIEYAMIFAHLGAEVTMLVRGDVLSSLTRVGIDHDIAAHLVESCHVCGIKIMEGNSPEAFSVDDRTGVSIQTKNKDGSAPVVQADVFLGCTGRTPTSANLGLEALGVELRERGKHIVVDPKTYKSKVPWISAAGDVIGPPGLASTAVQQAQHAVEAMFGSLDDVEEPHPVGMWTIPECSYFGLSAADAEKRGIDATEGVVEYSACLRGRVFAPTGLLKLVFNSNSKVIVGVHIIGEDACELVHYGMSLVQTKTTIFDILHTIYSAVTFHELFKEAALNGNSKLEFGIEWHRIFEHISPQGGDVNMAELVESGQLRAQFDEMDSNHSGALDADELVAVFEKVGTPMRRRAVENLIRLVDTNQDGTIEWEEFKKVALAAHHASA